MYSFVVAISSRFAVSLRWLVVGEPEHAALGLQHYLRVPERTLRDHLNRGVSAIVDEFAEHASDASRECLHYVLHERAGDSRRLFPNSPHPRDCDAAGVRQDRRLPGAQPPGPLDALALHVAVLSGLAAHRLFGGQAAAIGVHAGGR